MDNLKLIKEFEFVYKDLDFLTTVALNVCIEEFIIFDINNIKTKICLRMQCANNISDRRSPDIS
jgi:hypothetical protein